MRRVRDQNRPKLQTSPKLPECVSQRLCTPAVTQGTGRRRAELQRLTGEDLWFQQLSVAPSGGHAALLNGRVNG